MLKDYEKAEEMNHFSEESKDLIADVGKYRNLRVPREFFEETMPGLCVVLGNWNRILHMRQIDAAVGKESTVQKKTDLTYCRFLDT